MSVFLVSESQIAHTQRLPGAVIRDTEIENILKTWAHPLLKSAEMSDDSINLILIQNNQLNAFVAGGANMFLFTGLIEKTETPEELIGVMAHELGHITGGHLIALGGALERASYESIIGTIIGIGAAVLTGEAGAAAAVSGGFNSTAQRRFLANTRLNESAADQAALTFMDKSGINPEGLATFLHKLESQELLPPTQQSEYVRTHPLTRNRVDALNRRIQQSPHKGGKLPDLVYEQHKRMKAKLTGFINPGKVQWIYSDHDKSIPARYARAIAAYQLNDVESAIQQMDELLELEPKNPYFLELKGQMLVDFGRIDAALPFYKKSLDLLPNAPLVRINYAHALIEGSDKSAKSVDLAIKNLERAIQRERRSSRAQRLLANAYGKSGNEVRARLHLAEEAVLRRQAGIAKRHATFVAQNAKEGSLELIKAQDILSYLETIKRG